MKKRIRFVQGNEAVVEGSLYAGASFFAGYPITPSTEIAEHFSVRLPQVGGKFVQMEDELSAMCAIVGASLTGNKSITATSGPGFSLKQEALGFAVMAEIPSIIVNIQRGGPSTGNPTHGAQGDVMQARWGTHGDHSMVVMTASSIQDVFRVTIDAFNIAETFRTPVILLLDEVVGHMREKLVIPEPGEIPIIERLRTSVRTGVDYHPYQPREDGRLPMSDFGGKHRYNVTGLFHDMWGFPTTKPHMVRKLLRHMVDKIECYSNRICQYKKYYIEDAETLLISYGSSARTAMEMVSYSRKRGRKVGLLELQTLWPFPAEVVRHSCINPASVVVVEMNMGQMVQQVKAAVDDPGKIYLCNRYDGEMINFENVKDTLRIIQGKGI
ncbi:MAG: 2-oxoacid:acceptor oxidoreductase subunit alpha [Victivallales bacterium]|nr:2-oxoacid:acceptor oxidoreductase subunit alpha [Victivallales bacterium]